MKKRSKITLASMLALSVVLAGCGSKTDKTADGGSEGQGGTKTIHIFQFKVEIAEALNKLKADYEASHPGIKLDIQTVGGGSDYGAALKAKFASGEEPDIFNVGGYTDLNTWADKLEDLSGEKWVSDMVDVSKDQITKDGKIYGMPMNLEGYGFVYNKDLFKKAGITETPKTLTELDAAAKKLQDAEHHAVRQRLPGRLDFGTAYAERSVFPSEGPRRLYRRPEQGDGKIRRQPADGRADEAV